MGGTRLRPHLGLVAVVALSAAACGNDDPTAGLPDSNSTVSPVPPGERLSGTLSAAGSSGQTAAMAAWQAGYQARQPDVTVNYDPVGSGAGREQFLSGAIPFAGSDNYLDEEESEQATDVCGPDGALNLPVYISPIALPFNIEGVDTLNLSPEVIAGIFNQDITNWNHDAIAADNPHVELPDLDITVVNRSDDSGTTENFLAYLSAAAPEAWPHEPDGSWPVEGGEAANGNSGIIEVVIAANGSIGYTDASAAGPLDTANVGVGGEFVDYSAEAAATVVDNSAQVEGRGEHDLAIELARDSTEPGTYPIVLVSYLIVCTQYEDPTQADLVTSFLGYVASEEGQADAAEAASSAPISDDLRGQIEEAVESIEVG